MPEREPRLQDLERVKLIAQMTAILYGAWSAKEPPTNHQRLPWMKTAQRQAMQLLMVVDETGVLAPEGAPIHDR